MVRTKWQGLEPWRPFFWDRWLPTGVYLRAARRPVMLPSGHEADEEIYFGILLEVLLTPNGESKVLSFAGYAFLLDPGAHTRRSVRREGYWYYHMGEATSATGAINLLKHLMDFFEVLASARGAKQDYSDTNLGHVVSWDERIASAGNASYKRLKETPIGLEARR